MKSFWKENSKTISRLWLYQFAAAFMGIILSFVSSNLAQIFTLLFGIVTVMFYLCLIYMVMWEAGATEKIRIDGGRAEYKPLRGLYISLFANIPNFILFILILIGYVFGNKSGAFRMEWGGNLYVVAKSAALIWESMYNSFVTLYSPNNPVIFLLMILPSLAVCTVGYVLGLKNFKILGGKFALGKNKEKKGGPK
ncbi:MAG: hypothetical protein IKI03_01830 [Clostridia bacterium]|nr:hypothetical protein [Clostridia bacterium]